MRMAMVAYNEAVEREVIEALESCGLKNYSKITGAFGKGTASGTHLGNDVWPGRNNILFAAGEEAGIKKLVCCIRELRKSLGSEGVKAFVIPLEEVT